MSTITPRRFLFAVVLFSLVGAAIAWVGGNYTNDVQFGAFGVLTLFFFCMMTGFVKG